MQDLQSLSGLLTQAVVKGRRQGLYCVGLNILICTPGRLLQHMDETPNFDASSIQILVLDEADRILDMVCKNPSVPPPFSANAELFSTLQANSIYLHAEVHLRSFVNIHGMLRVLHANVDLKNQHYAISWLSFTTRIYNNFKSVPLVQAAGLFVCFTKAGPCGVAPSTLEKQACFNTSCPP